MKIRELMSLSVETNSFYFAGFEIFEVYIFETLAELFSLHHFGFDARRQRRLVG